jgi:hypothetical protein
LLRKSFQYGTAVLLMRLAGCRYALAGIAVALGLAFIEGAQVFLRGRTAESTDPLMALLLAFVLWRVEMHFR